MINTVIFDIGNVMIDFDWGEYIFDLFDRDTAAIVKNAIFSEFWNEIDRGVLSDEEMINGFIERAGGFEKEIRVAFAEVGRALSLRPYAIPWIKELKAEGYRVLYFTKYMDGGIFSCDVKLIKPDPAIYAALRDAYSLEPGECVFIDDNIKNIEAAKDFGLNTVHFTDYGSAREELCKILNQKAVFAHKICTSKCV